MTLKQSEREIRRLRPGDELDVLDAAPLFDREPTLQFATRFLTSVGHHLLIAYEGGIAAGFVSGVEMTHPDKETEMFLYELGVAEPARGPRGLCAGRWDAAAQPGIELSTPHPYLADLRAKSGFSP